jgi:mRNA-degrading endonuclease YafQ of YafQ-DinJ toxin-antitoxin module
VTSPRLRLLWSPSAIQRLGSLARQGCDFAKLKAAAKHLRVGTAPRAKQFHAHALTRELTGWHSLTIGTDPHKPTGHQRIIMVYRVSDDAVEIAFLDHHDAAYKHAKAR